MELSDIMMINQRALWKVCFYLAVCVALTCEFCVSSLIAAEPTGFLSRIYKDDVGEHKYVVFVPAGYSPDRKWPVILFLHGAGERGNDGRLHLTVGLAPLVKSRERNFPFIVVFPQAEDVRGRILTGWSPDTADGKRALAILGQVENDFAVDRQREILTGWSMGGYGAWNMAATFPDRWSAVVPVSAGGESAWAEKLKNANVWSLHGAKDKIVAPSESKNMTAALRKAGGRPIETEFPTLGHDVWKLAFDQDALYAWMLDPQTFRGKSPPISLPPEGTTVFRPELDLPFVPAVEISNAVYLRLGNDALAALAESIPSLVPRDMLAGRLNDISDYTSSEGHSFSVYFSGISYAGQLARAVVRGYARDRLNIQLGLSNVTITIGATSVEGSGKSAYAGPISIVIGNRRPAWMSFDVTPVVVDRKLRLKLGGTLFQIDNDNWSVSSPAGVSTRGLGMTSDKVAGGLVSGLYGSKQRIEQQVISVIPNIVAELEKRLDVSQADQLVSGVWPLPVYQPRLRVWPGEISTDERGVTLVMGVTAGAVDALQPPRQVTRAAASGMGANQVPAAMSLQVGVAPQLLNPLSDLLVKADVARIHVLDTPARTLGKLADRKVMAEIIPDLQRHGDKVEIWTELAMASPIGVKDATRAATGITQTGVETLLPASATVPESTKASEANKQGAVRAIEFDVPKIVVTVALRTDLGSDKRLPCAEFEIKLQQTARPLLLKPNTQTRLFSLNWDPEAKVTATGRFVDGYQAENSRIDVQKFQKLFADGWEEFIQGGSETQTVLPDLEIGSNKLRAMDIAWNAPTITATYGIPGVRIINNSDVKLVYETQGANTGWGGPYTLPPNDDHHFPIASPLIYRRKTDKGVELFTLPAGSTLEFSVPKEGGEPRLFMVP